MTSVAKAQFQSIIERCLAEHPPTDRTPQMDHPDFINCLNEGVSSEFKSAPSPSWLYYGGAAFVSAGLFAISTGYSECLVSTPLSVKLLTAAFYLPLQGALTYFLWNQPDNKGYFFTSSAIAALLVGLFTHVVEDLGPLNILAGVIVAFYGIVAIHNTVTDKFGMRPSDWRR
ncbi:MAG: hypothetical protein HYT76_04465 [Deltaproteobacteria bacterium]|nr:hypothetical protein [Deltaproteobacteria bacterium]